MGGGNKRLSYFGIIGLKIVTICKTENKQTNIQQMKGEEGNSVLIFPEV